MGRYGKMEKARAEDSSLLTPRRALIGAQVFIIYVIITLGMTYPWALHFNTHTPDGGGEGSVGLWNLWHFHYGLLHGSPFETNLLAPPYKLNLIFHAYTLSRDLLALPLLPTFGPVVTSNLLTVLSFGLSGLGMWLVVYDLTRDAGASFVAGLIYAFAPYRFAHLSGHYNLIAIEWLPFYVLYALRYLSRGTWRNLVLSALFALLTSLTDYYYALYLIVWTALLVLVRLVCKSGRLQTLARTALLAGTTLVIHLPLLGLMYWAFTQGVWVGRPTGQGMLETFSADLAAFVTPSSQHALFGSWADQISQTFTANFAERTVYLGLLPLSLAIIASLRFRKWPVDGRWWILAFWVFVLLALGPVLHWRSAGLFPLPYQWLGDVPVFREARIPSRWTVMVILALGVLAGQTLAWIGQRWGRRVGIAATVSAALIILFEYLPVPLQLADRSVPSVYHTIARDMQQGSVLDLPFGMNDSFRGLGGWNPRALYFQTVTARPVIGAHVSRIPTHVFEAYAQMPLIGRLARIEQGESFTTAEIIADQHARDQVVETLDLRFIIVPDWYQETPGHMYIRQVFDGCLEALPGDDRALGYRVMRPCPAMSNETLHR